MSKHNIVFIGLDSQKEFNEVAYIQDQRGAKPVHLGRISSSKLAIKKLIRQFESKYPHATLHFVYEAGPCGYWIYRLITSLGHCCYVVAPSLIPKKPGERIKTDKRDALKLAKLLKSEDLTPIYVPEPEDEAIRDLSRAREVAMKDLKDAKYQLKALLLRNNINYAGTANWSLKHLRWLTELVLSHPAQQIVLQESSTPVYVEYSITRPNLIGNTYNANTDYAVDDQVYYSTTGQFYDMIVNAGAGTVPTTTNNWAVTSIPKIFENYLIRGIYADYLRANGQIEIASLEDRTAEAFLTVEADKVYRQQGQVKKINFVGY